MGEEITAEQELGVQGRKLVFNVDFTCTARSKQDNLGRLFDDNLEEYYQTNSSCPHWVCCHFNREVCLKTFAIYLDREDSSYKPDKLSLSTSEDGTQNRIEVRLEHKTGWFIIPCNNMRTTLLRFSSDHNYTGGCDCRIHQVAIFSGHGILKSTLQHRQCLVNDLAVLRDDRTLVDIELKAYDNEKTIKCHSIIVAPNSELVTTMFSWEKAKLDKKEQLMNSSESIQLVKLDFGIPYKLLNIFVKFSYKGPGVLCKYLDNDDFHLPEYNSPDCVVKTFGNAAPLLALGRCLMCKGIENMAAEHILSKVPLLVSGGGSQAAWRWLSNMAPPQLTKRIGSVLANSIALTNTDCSGLLCSVTPDQLRSILSCAVSTPTLRKGKFVKLRSTAITPDLAKYSNEVGLIENISAKTCTIKFAKETVSVDINDVIQVSVVNFEKN